MNAISRKVILFTCVFCLPMAAAKSAGLLLTPEPLSASESLPTPEPLPDPLSLEYSLTLAEQNNVILSLAENELFASRIKSDLLRSDTGLNVALKTRSRWVESPQALRYLGREDHAAKIIVTKSLYDFGRTSNQLLAGRQNEVVSVLQIKQSKQTHRLRIMRAFFDVILADLMYARDNEAMAMGYIHYDRTKERASLGQRSELDVLEKDSAYQYTRQARYQSESRQRLTRNYLSLLLDRPDQLASKLIMPSLQYHKLKIKDVDVLYAAALQNNLKLEILGTRLSVLLHQMKSIRAQRLPIVSAEVEASIYERNIGSNDVWRAGVLFEVPIYQGGKISAKTALKKAEIKKLEFEIYQKQQQIKQETLDHWLALSDLSIQRLASNTLFDYREYYLDRARALYEMEVKSDLGDSMVKLSAASLKVADAQFETAMRWEMLAQLTQMTIAEMTITQETVEEKAQ